MDLLNRNILRLLLDMASDDILERLSSESVMINNIVYFHHHNSGNNQHPLLLHFDPYDTKDVYHSGEIIRILGEGF